MTGPPAQRRTAPRLLAALLPAILCLPLAAAGQSAKSVPYFPAASDPLGRQGFVQVMNLSDDGGTVSITAFDDGGREHGPVSLSLDARQTKHFNSGDLQDGNAAKGLPTGIGAPTTGDWRLAVSADDAIRVLSLLSTPTGHLTNLSAVPAGFSFPGTGTGQTFRDCPECPEMVALPSGSFRMGCLSNDGSCSPDEFPVHGVTIARPFALGVYEVTFVQWDACVAAGGCGGHRPYDRGWSRGDRLVIGDRPVINVSWEDAQLYVQWLSRRTGHGYRLPSESEWEYAARSGTSTKYWWGDGVGVSRANCDGCGSRWDDRSTAPVGSFAASPWGLHDMHGNVWEWVGDCWNGSHEGAPADGSARNSRDCAEGVLRGGSWNDIPRHLRSANRLRYLPGDWNYNVIGFRVARTLTP